MIISSNNLGDLMKALVKKPFYFMRHGRTDWNERELCQGFTDIPLNETGCREISEACPFIQNLKFEKIVSSPLKRALQSAQILQKACNKPLTIVEELKERHWGDVEGNSSHKMYEIEELEEKDALFNPGQNIEPKAAFKNRILTGLNQALADNEIPLIVSHGRLFLVLTEILNIPPIKQISNGSVIKCTPTPTKWEVNLHSPAKIV